MKDREDIEPTLTLHVASRTCSTLAVESFNQICRILASLWSTTGSDQELGRFPGSKVYGFLFVCLHAMFPVAQSVFFFFFGLFLL